MDHADDIGVALYRCDQARAIEAAAVAAGVPALELMHRAGAAAFALLERHWPASRRVGVVCGSGNNGGDGYVLARLARAAGREVDLFAPAPPRTPLAQQAAAEWQAAGGTRLTEVSSSILARADVLVDALFGIGLRQGPDTGSAAWIGALNRAARPLLALDVPSGLDADRGIAPGACVRATRTLSFIVGKRGLHTGSAREFCGELDLASLDVPDSCIRGLTPSARLLAPGDLSRWLPRRERHAHKGRHGRVLVVGGDHGYAGAIRLCAEAALRGGTGLVRVATRAEHLAAVVAARPEAMVQAVESPQALQAWVAQADVLALGPGLGLGDWGRTLFDVALEARCPLVLDADALTWLARAPRPLSEAVLTPHPGEAARLLGASVSEVESDRFAAAQALVDRYQAVVVLKGAGTLVAAPGRVPAVIGAGNPGMASGGMGDVLTGVVAAMRAQGLGAFDAARAGALLHAAAGDRAAARGGERGLLASDLFGPLRELANPA